SGRRYGPIAGRQALDATAWAQALQGLHTSSTCKNSNSTGVERPKILTITFNLPRSGLTSLITPVKLVNGPSITRTFSPSSKSTLGLGSAASPRMCLWICITSSSDRGVGSFAPPRSPVTLGVSLMTYQMSSLISASMRRYPGKNLRDETRRFPPLTSTTSSMGTRTCPTRSRSPKALRRSSRLALTLFSYPEYVCTTYHCLLMPSRPSGHLRILWSTLANTRSTIPRYKEIIPTAASTTTVDASVSWRDGKVTLRTSDRTSRRNCTAFSYVSCNITVTH